MSVPAAEISDYAWRGRTGPFRLRLTPSVFVPSSTSRVLADCLEVEPGDVVLDVGCGCGILSFVAARLGAARVYGCDVSEESVVVAKENARLLGLDGVTEFRSGNLVDPVRDVRADLVIGDVSGIPDALAEATGWFPDGRGGGPTGAELPVAMIEGLPGSLNPGARMFLPTATIQDEERILDAARSVFGGERMTVVGNAEFPLPETVAHSEAVEALLERGVVRLERRGSRLLWRLTVWRCELPPE